LGKNHGSPIIQSLAFARKEKAGKRYGRGENARGEGSQGKIGRNLE
jgi:hypothetical protein